MSDIKFFSDCNQTSQVCENTLGSYVCQDLDECSESVHKCDHAKSNCINTDGSYSCDCFSGYKGFLKIVFSA